MYITVQVRVKKDSSWRTTEEFGRSEFEIVTVELPGSSPDADKVHIPDCGDVLKHAIMAAIQNYYVRNAPKAEADDEEE